MVDNARSGDHGDYAANCRGAGASAGSTGEADGEVPASRGVDPSGRRPSTYLGTAPGMDEEMERQFFLFETVGGGSSSRESEPLQCRPGRGQAQRRQPARGRAQQGPSSSCKPGEHNLCPRLTTP